MAALLNSGHRNSIDSTMPLHFGWGIALFLFCATKSDAAIYHVKIEGMLFVPSSLETNRGDTVIWENNDLVPHTVTALDRSKKNLESGSIQSGKKFSYKLRSAGTIDYFCRFHPLMKGSILIRK